ncbi:MAG TPA: NUDIX hydrolase [Acidimicrobiales bacterium]|nr:NUDIX hydrolase [Acidimicrobiales bacterium]
MADEPEVRAAGGIPWRHAGDALEVLVIRRPRYDDWTFPKGKLDPGETWEQAAVREVWEETGIVAVLSTEIAGTEYRDRYGCAKQVRYWSMPVAADAGFEPNDEVSERRWMSVAEAARLLSYDHDRRVLDSLVGLLER